MLKPLATDGAKRIAVYGTGEAAELAYLSLKECGIEPVGILDGEGHGTFLGMPVRPLKEHEDLRFDLLIVATMEKPDALVNLLLRSGISEEKLLTLRPRSSERQQAAPVAEVVGIEH